MRVDSVYRGIIQVGRVLMGFQGLQVTVAGTERIPAEGGAILAFNHTGYMDFVYGGYAPWRAHRRLVRYMAKASTFKTPGVGWLMNVMGHIPVDRIDGSESFNKAVELARAGDFIGIFPEATISRSFEIKTLRTGAVRIAHEAGVPVVPVLMFGSQRIWTKGGRRNLGRTKVPLYVQVMEPFTPTGDPVADTAKLRGLMQEGLSLTWDAYRRDHGEFPKGASWVPARFGGGAPTLEEAQREDDAIEQERHRVRQLNEDLTSLNERIKEVTHNAVDGAYQAYEKLTGDEEARNLASLAHWVKTTADQLAAEGVAGVKEGAGRVSQASEQLRSNTTALYNQLTATGWEAYDGSKLEEVLTTLASQTRQIMDRLPERMRGRVAGIPDAVVLDVEGTLAYEGMVGERSISALQELHSRGVEIILTSENGYEAVDAAAGQLGIPVVGLSDNGALSYRFDNGQRSDVELRGHFTPGEQGTVAGILQDVSEDLQVSWGYSPEGEVVRGEVRSTDPTVDKKTLLNLLAEPLGQEAFLSVGTAADTVYLAPRGISKAGEVESFLEGQEDVLAIGDSPADMALLARVHTGIAMGNADGEVLRACRWATADAADDGVGMALWDVLDEVHEREAREKEGAAAKETRDNPEGPLGDPKNTGD